MVSLTAAKLQVVIGADSSQAQAEMNAFASKVQNFGRNSAIAGSLLSLGLTVPIIGLAKAAIKTGAEFQASMNIFQAVTSATATQMKAAQKEAIALGADLTLPKVSANDAADAMTELAKAGLSVNDTLAAAKGALQLAQAGDLQFADAARIAANQLNAFKLSGDQATHVADLLAAAANASSAEVTDLATAASYVAPQWDAAGQSIDSMITAIAQMSNAGVIGSKSGTQLRQMIMKLESPTKAGAAAMASLGINIWDAQGKMVPFRSIIEQFTAATKNLTQEQKTQALNMIFGIRAQNAANLVLTQGTDLWDKNYVAVTKSGAAAALAGARMKGLSGAFEALKSQVETVLLKIILPFMHTMENLVRTLANLVPLILKVPQPILRLAAGFLLVMAALGPLLLLIAMLSTTIGTLLTSSLVPVFLVLASITGALSASRTAWRLFRDSVITAEEALTGHWRDDASRILLVHRAVGVLFTGIRNFLIPVLQIVRDSFMAFKNALQGDWINNNKLTGFAAIMSFVGATIRFVWMAIVDLIKYGHIASGTMLGFQGALKVVINVLAVWVSYIYWVTRAIVVFYKEIFKVAEILINGFRREGFTGFIKAIPAALLQAIKAFKDYYKTLIDGLKLIDWASIGRSFFDGIKQVIKTATEKTIDLTNWVIAEFDSIDWNKVWNTLWKWMQWVWSQTTSKAIDLTSWVVGIFTGIDWNSVGSALWNGIVTAFNFMVSGAIDITNWFIGVVNSVNWGNVSSSIGSGFGTAFSAMKSSAIDITNWFTGVVTSVDWKNLANDILDGFVIAFDNLKTGVIDLSNWVSGVVTSVDWRGLAGDIESGFGTAFNAISTGAVSLTNWFTGVVTSVDWKSLAGSIGSGINTAVSSIGTDIVDLTSWFGGVIDSVNWSSLGSNAGSGIQTAWDSIKTGSVDLTSWAKSVIVSIDWTSLGSSITTGLETAFYAIKSGTISLTGWVSGVIAAVDWTSLATDIGSGFQTSYDAIVQGTVTATNFIVDTVNSVDWASVGTALQAGFVTAIGGMALAGSAITTWLVSSVKSVDWKQVGAAISSGLQSAINSVSTKAGFGDILGTSQITESFGNFSVVVTQVNPVTKAIDDLRTKVQAFVDFLKRVFTPAVNNWINAFIRIKDRIQEIINKAKDLITAFQDLNQAFAPLMTSFKNFGDSLHDLNMKINNFVSASTGGAVSIQKLGMFVSTFFGTAAILMIAQFGNSLAVLGAILPDIINTMTAPFILLMDIMTTTLNITTDVVNTIDDLIHGKWKAAWGDANQAVLDFDHGVTQALGDVWDWVASFFGIFGDMIGTTIGSIYTDITGNKMPNLVQGMGKAISNLPSTIGGYFSQMYLDVMGWVVSLATDSPTQLAEGAAGLIKSVEDLPVKITSYFQEMTTDVIQEVANLATMLISKGIDVVEGLISGVISDFENLKTAVGEIIGTVLSPFEDAATGAITWLVQSGKDFIQGFINGILSMPEKLTDAVGSVISAGVNYVKSQGHSPWPVMIASGIDMIMGLVVGITSTQQTAVKAASDMVKAVIGAIQDGFNLAKNLSLGMPSIDLGVIDKISQMADKAVQDIAPIAARYSKDFTTALNSMGTAIKSGVDALSATLDLANKIVNDGVVIPSKDMVTAIKNMADWVIQALSDSANYFDANILSAAATYGDAMKTAFGGMASAIDFVQKIANGGIILPTHDLINRIKDMADWVVKALSDSGAVYNGKLASAASQFGQAMKDAFSGMASAVDFVRSMMKGSIEIPTADIINRIKDMADIVVKALSDSGAVYNGKMTTDATNFGNAMKDAFSGMSAAISFIRDLAENGIVIPGKEVIQSIIDFTSTAILGMSTAANDIGGTFVSDAQAFGKSLSDAFNGLDSIVKLATDLTDTFSLPVTTLIDKLVSLGAYAVKQMGLADKDIYGFVDEASSFGSAIKDAFDGLASVVKFAQDLAKGQIYVPFQSLIDNMITFAAAAVKAMGVAGKKISGDLIAGSKTLGNGIKAAFDGIDQVVKFIQDVQSLGNTIVLPYNLVDVLGKFATDLINAFADAAHKIDTDALATAQQYANGIRSLFDGVSSIMSVIKDAADVVARNNIGSIILRSTEALINGLNKAESLVSSDAIQKTIQYANDVNQLYQIMAPVISVIASLADIRPIRNNLSNIFQKATKALTDAIKAMHGEAINALSEAEMLVATMEKLQSTLAHAGVTLTFTGANINFGGEAIFGINGTGGSAGGLGSGGVITGGSSRNRGGTGVSLGQPSPTPGPSSRPYGPPLAIGAPVFPGRVYNDVTPGLSVASQPMNVNFNIDGKVFHGVVDNIYEQEMTNQINLQKVPI